MVFEWGLSDSKSPKSPGLFSVFWLIWIMLSLGRSPQVLLSFRLIILHQFLKIVPSAQITVSISAIFMFHSFLFFGIFFVFFFPLKQGLDSYLSSNFTLWSAGWKSSLFGRFSICCCCCCCCCCWLLLGLGVLEKFVRLILLDRF